MAKTVLIVHDNLTKLGTLQDALENGGYEISVLSNKDEIVSKSMELLPDLILIDIQIPTKEGYSICRQLRESPQTQHIKVIIIKNESNPMDKSWAVLKGAEFYMATKNPFSEDNLAQSIADME